MLDAEPKPTTQAPIVAAASSQPLNSLDAADPSIPPAGPGPDRSSASGDPARQLWMHTNGADRELERMHHGTPIQCQFCVGQKFRRSRLRSADIRQLLLMRYPVRCTRCSQRQTVSFTVAGVSVPSYLRQRSAGSPRPSTTRLDPESPHFLPAESAAVPPIPDRPRQDPASGA